MKKIFISYRHSESVAAMAQLIHDRLDAYFGASAVFLDSDYLVAGEPFPEVLDNCLASCDTFLALIDPHWIASVHRFQDPDDWVRREVETVLRRRADEHVLVMPVLLPGAAMPDKATLPASMAPLVDMHAPPSLHGATLEQDIAALVMILDRKPPAELIKWMQARRRTAAAVSLGVLLLFSTSLMSLFDYFYIDTGLQAVTLALADVIDNRSPSDRLAIVAIDAGTLEKLGRETLDKTWRQEHAKVIERLAAAGAAVVVFDLFLRGESAYDADLIAAAQAARAKGTLVIFGSSPDKGAPVASAFEHGLLCVGRTLNLARSTPLVVRRPLAARGSLADGEPGWEYTASLGAKAAWAGATIIGVDTANRQVLLSSRGGAPLLKPFSHAEHVAVGHDRCDGLAPGDLVALRAVRLTRLDLLRDPAIRHRYEDLLADSAAGAQAYKGKIVLVGSTDKKDRVWVLRGLGRESRYGYEFQADVINTLLQDINIRSPALLPQLLLMLAMGVLGSLGRFWSRLQSTRLGRLYVWAVPLTYLAFSALLCAFGQLLLNGTYDLAAFGFAYWISGKILQSRRLWTLTKN